MSKARRNYLTRLNTLAAQITDVDIKWNVKHVLELYEDKQISQFATARNLIKSFTSKTKNDLKKKLNYI